MDWSRKGLVDFNAGKTQLVLFNGSNNTGAIYVKMDVVVLEMLSFKMLGLTLLFKLHWASYLFLKLPPKKVEPWFVL